MKTMRRQQVEVRQLFNLTILARQSGKVRRPDVPTVSRATVIRHHISERPVERVGVDADHLHPLLDQPQRPIAAESRLTEILARIDPLVRSRLQQHDVERLEHVRAAIQRRPQVIDRDLLARLFVSHIEHDSGSETPLQRHLVDPLGRFAARSRSVVIRRIDVRAGVRDRGDLFNRPTLAVRVNQVFRLHSEELPHLDESFAVVRDVTNRRRQRFADGGVFERNAQVDDSHSWQHRGRVAIPQTAWSVRT